MKLQLKAKHFLHTQYSTGNGPIKEALKEAYPGKRIFQGVELTNVGGKHWYHQMYSRKRYEKGLGKSIFSVSDPETIIETIELTETYK
jgi:hypothetical protein